MNLMLSVADDPGKRLLDFQLDFLREMRKENRIYFPISGWGMMQP